MKANNLKLGAIYKHGLTDEPMRLVTILPCEGVWMETYDGRGYGEKITFEDVHYADSDEVQDFLEDVEVMNNNTLQKGQAFWPTHQADLTMWAADQS